MGLAFVRSGSTGVGVVAKSAIDVWNLYQKGTIYQTVSLGPSQ